MSFQERELKELIEIKDISLAYEESYDLNISDRGIFIVDLELELSEFNEGDTLLLKLNQDITKNFTILTRQKTYIEIKETLINQGDGCKIQIINKSDDVLLINMIRGGIFVDNLLQITAVYNINPKSFDLTLNEPFDGTEVIKVYETNVPSKVIPISVVPSSLTSDPNTRVVLVSTDIASDYFQPNKNYTLVVKKGTEIANYMFSYANFNPISDATVTSFGYRIIKVSFEYPVKNLKKTQLNTVTGHTELQNFYLLYYGMDTDASNVADKNWLGYISIDGTTGNKADISEDLRTLTIEFGQRSMPIGNHKFIINYSKLQDIADAIQDYQNRTIPIIDKLLSVAGAVTSTRPTEVIVLSRQELIVKFNNAVELKDSEKPLRIEGYNLQEISKSRVGNDYNAIQYKVNALPLGNVDLIVDPITDAYGYPTERRIFNITVLPQPLYVVNITQEAPQPPSTDTVLLVKFSSTLDQTSAQTTANYRLTNNMGVLQVPISATLQLPDRNVVKLLYNTLPAGTYNMNIQNVKDTLNTVMDVYDEPILIEDFTEPFVEIILARENVMVIKFNEPMNVSPVSENSALDALNYTLRGAILPPLTETAPMQNNKWIRFELPFVQPIDYPQLNNPVQVGYARVKTVRYVTNASGNIYPLCTNLKVDQIITTPVSIDNPACVIEILDERSFIFKCAGEDELLSIYKEDFILISNTVSEPIYEVELIDTKTFKVTMVNDIFDAYVTNVDFSTKPLEQEIVSRDIFNMPIKNNAKFVGTVKNLLNAKLKAISLISTDPNPGVLTVTLAMKFTNIIQTTSKDDFMVKLNNTTILPIISATIVPTNKDTIQLLVKLSNPLIFTDILTVSIAREMEVVQTIDINDNKIGYFRQQLVQKFTERNISWTGNNGIGIVNDKLSVVFNGPINPRSLDPAWDGVNPITIAIGDLKIEELPPVDSANVTEMRVASGLWGRFLVFTTKNQKFVAVNTANQAPVTISLTNNGTTLEFKFNNDTIVANIAEVMYAIYDPKPYTSNEEDSLYVNEDYTPTTRPQS